MTFDNEVLDFNTEKKGYPVSKPAACVLFMHVLFEFQPSQF